MELDLEPDQEEPHTEAKRQERVDRLAADLRGGRKVTDAQFDQIFPPLIRKLSGVHWTPVEIAIRAAELLATGEKTRVLDVGSGAGKFCLVASLSARGQFTGVEQRLHLLQTAKNCAEELGASQASFVLGNMADLDWDFFDAFYLFNPFYENVLRSIRIDNTVSHSQVKFNRAIETVRNKLIAARLGTKVVTYHGFGGEVPRGYHRLKREPIGTSCLELWVKLEACKPYLSIVDEGPTA